MTKAEREKLISEKNTVIGRQKESQTQSISSKRRAFFVSNSTGIKYEESNDNNSNLTATDKALLKVVLLMFSIHSF